MVVCISLSHCYFNLFFILKFRYYYIILAFPNPSMHSLERSLQLTTSFSLIAVLHTQAHSSCSVNIILFICIWLQSWPLGIELALCFDWVIVSLLINVFEPSGYSRCQPFAWCVDDEDFLPFCWLSLCLNNNFLCWAEAFKFPEAPCINGRLYFFMLVFRVLFPNPMLTPLSWTIFFFL